LNKNQPLPIITINSNNKKPRKPKRIKDEHFKKIRIDFDLFIV
jgi:hypothetical protein